MNIVTDMANEGDIPAIMSLLKQVHKVHADGRPDLFPGESKYTANDVKEILTNPLFPVLVAREEGKTVGYAFCKLSSPDFAPQVSKRNSLYIDDLCVDESMRGKGVGRILYNAALAFARAHDCYNVTLNVWELNTSAKAFYQKMGLVPLRTTMEKIL